MLTAITLPFKNKLSRFDWLVISVLLGLALGTLLLIWRGDQVGVQVVSVYPGGGLDNVSTRTTIEITFDQPMAAAADPALLTIEPPLAGDVRWRESTLIFTPAAPLNPETEYTISLAEDLQSRRGRSLEQPASWRFTTRHPVVLYVGMDENDVDQLFTADPNGDPPRQLTDEPFGVFDYQLAADGASIVYAALREDGGSDLWGLTVADGERYPLLQCPDAVCSGAAWSPAGNRLVYERRTMLVANAAPGPPRLWWLEPAGGDTVQMFADNQVLGYGASWSANGQWLSYVAPSSQGVQVYNVEDGRSLVVPSRMGGLAVWHPQDDTFLVSDIQRSDAGFAVHLLKATPEEGELLDITGEGAAVEDSSPDWSPAGDTLVFTRKVAGASMGKQLWLMDADGSNARYLTNDTDIHHSLPQWSPSGRLIVYHRFPLQEINAVSSVWLLDVASGESRQLVPAGNRPTWLP